MLNATQLANRVKWVRALLSGNFKQARSFFKEVRGGQASYCCLGVACELVAPESTSLHVVGALGHTSAIMMSNEEASEFFGMGSDDQKEAMRWNDTYEFSFVRIADLVAYATENDVPFRDANDVPDGYAVEWLKRF